MVQMTFQSHSKTTRRLALIPCLYVLTATLLLGYATRKYSTRGQPQRETPHKNSFDGRANSKTAPPVMTAAAAGEEAAAPRVRYVEVEKSEGEYPQSRQIHTRYVAYEPDLPEGGNTSRWKPEDNGGGKVKWIPMSIRRWADLMEGGDGYARSDDAAMGLTDLIKKSGYEALFFETRPASSISSIRKQFEVVLVDAPELKRFVEAGGPDEKAFAEHLTCVPDSETCCAFPNLGGDANLVVPRITGGTGAKVYGHLGAFVRGASEREVRQLWHTTAREYIRTLENAEDKDRNIWLSTSGMGVAWLHIRLDSTPKYYTYTPFRDEK